MWTLMIPIRSGLTERRLTLVKQMHGYRSWPKIPLCRGLILFALTLVAACGPSPPPREASYTGTSVPGRPVLDREMPVSALLGRTVVDPTGRELGTIQLIARRLQTQDLYAVLQRPGEAAPKQTVVALRDLEWDDGKLLLPAEEWRGGRPSRPELRVETYNPTRFAPLRPACIIGPHGPGGGGDC